MYMYITAIMLPPQTLEQKKFKFKFIYLVNNYWLQVEKLKLSIDDLFDLC